jgi:hypothetical protein
MVRGVRVVELVGEALELLERAVLVGLGPRATRPACTRGGPYPVFRTNTLPTPSWLYLSMGNRRHAQIAWRSVSPEPLAPTCLQAEEVETRERTVGHQDLTRLRGFADASGDVDVDAEVVSAESPRTAPMDAGAHAGPVPVELNTLQGVLGFERGVRRSLRCGERRHQAVSEALHGPAFVGGDRGFDDGVDLAQQLERGGVAGLQLPRGKLDEIGEQNRQLDVAAPTGQERTSPCRTHARETSARSARSERGSRPPGSTAARCSDRCAAATSR